jgi:hypothetical protein
VHPREVEDEFAVVVAADLAAGDDCHDLAATNHDLARRSAAGLAMACNPVSRHRVTDA